MLSADAAVIRGNLTRVKARIARACERSDRRPADVRLCVAGKYVTTESMGQLADAGVTIVGENRLQDLVAKQDLVGDKFEWHFIGAIQSRKIAQIAKRVTLIHSLCTESAARKLGSLESPPDTLVQVNIANEPSKQGLAVADLDEFLTLLPRPPIGLMTMPPASEDPEMAREHFATLAGLAHARGMRELSMGTSQDFEVAVEEGATIVRLGGALFAPID